MSEDQNSGLDDNPYRSPIDGGNVPVGGSESGHVVTPTVLSTLRQTQPWVRFLSVVGFVASALMVFGGVGLFIFAASMHQGANPGLFVVSLVYIPIGLLYFIPSLFLFRYASRINALWTNGTVRHLEDALQAQKSFWKFVGILVLIVIALYFMGIVLAFVLGAVRVMR
jgi:hypothetical protein